MSSPPIQTDLRDLAELRERARQACGDARDICVDYRRILAWINFKPPSGRDTGQVRLLIPL
jgi:hypothetical protein